MAAWPVMALVLAVGSGCAATSALEHKVGVLEGQLGDLQRNQARLEKKLSEIMIQLAVLMNQRTGQTSGTQGDHHTGPNLQVAKMEPRSSASVSTGGRHQGSQDPRAEEPIRLDRNSIKTLPADSIRLDDSADTFDAAVPREGDEQGQQRSPDPGDEQIVKARKLLTDGRAEECLVLLRDFERTHPAHPDLLEVLRMRADAAWAVDRVDVASQLYAELAGLRKVNPGMAAHAMWMLGRCHEKQNRVRDARSAYLQLVQAFPLSVEAGRANQRLQGLN